MPMANYLRSKLYNHVLTHTTFTSPTTVYAELCTSASAPTASSAGTASGAGRVAVAWAADTNGTGNPSADIVWTSVGAGTYRYVELYDASTTGNRLFYKQLSSDVVLGSTGNVTISAAQASATFT